MKLVKYHPFNPSRTLASFFNDFEDQSLNSWLDRSPMVSSPSINIKETDSAYQVELAAPGLKKEDFKIEIKEDQLFISAEKKEEEKEESNSYKRREFKYTSFTKRFYLPNEVDAEQINAAYNEGILFISIPKIKKEELVKQIQVS